MAAIYCATQHLCYEPAPGLGRARRTAKDRGEIDAAFPRWKPSSDQGRAAGYLGDGVRKRRGDHQRARATRISSRRHERRKSGPCIAPAEATAWRGGQGRQGKAGGGLRQQATAPTYHCQRRGRCETHQLSEIIRNGDLDFSCGGFGFLLRGFGISLRRDLGFRCRRTRKSRWRSLNPRSGPRTRRGRRRCRSGSPACPSGSGG